MKTSIATVSGNYFDYVDLDSNVVTIMDVATGLGNECRFAGQLREHYSVAQHSVLVSRILKLVLGADRPTVRYGLFHDASEAFCKDLPTPLKKLLPDYYKIEARVQEWLCKRFEVLNDPARVNMELVQEADLLALAVEKRDLLQNNDKWLYLKDIDPLFNVLVQTVSPSYARRMWLDAWFESAAEIDTNWGIVC